MNSWKRLLFGRAIEIEIGIGASELKEDLGPRDTGPDTILGARRLRVGFP